MLKKNLDTLNPTMWLEDIVIEAYLKYLVCKSNSDIVVYDTFLYPDNIKRLQKSISIKYLIPIFESKHWSLIYINRNNLYYYDSQLSDEHTKKVLSCFSKYKKYNIITIGGPQQTNNSDCGIFLLYSCNRILKGFPVRYDPQKAMNFRSHVKMRLSQLYNLQ